MYFEEYGKGNEETVVMLHGACFVFTFGRQYILSEKYHIIVPHITGFGNETETVFTTEKAAEDIIEIIRKQNKKVTLVGFSLGAQLGFYIAAKAPELLKGAVLVSPWLIKDENKLKNVLEQNEKMLRTMQNRFLCNIIGIMNFLPKKQRKEFVEQTQRVQPQTIRNVVKNNIDFDSVPEFEKIEIPVLAIAGEKEENIIKLSVEKMAEINQNCNFEIWEKAAHNIPPVFAKRFNLKLIEFINGIT